MEQHPPTFLVYDNANIIYACSDHYDTALSLLRAVTQNVYSLRRYKVMKGYCKHLDCEVEASTA